MVASKTFSIKDSEKPVTVTAEKNNLIIVLTPLGKISLNLKTHLKKF